MFAAVKAEVGPGVKVVRMAWRTFSGDAKGSVYDGELTTSFFANKDLKGSPVVVRKDKVIDFDWGEKPPVPSSEANAGVDCHPAEARLACLDDPDRP